MGEKFEKLNVRQLISKYENLENNNNSSGRAPLQRSKSFGNILGSYSTASKSNLYKTSSTLSLVQFDKESLASLDDIEKALIRLETHLNYYETYNKERHIQFQNQLFDIFGCILTFGEERNGKKAELKDMVQNLFAQLNDVLPVNYTNPSKTDTVKIHPFTTVTRTVSQRPATKPEAFKKRVNTEILEKYESFQSEKEAKTATNSAKYESSPKPEAKKVETQQEVGGIGLLSVTKLRSLFEKKNEENSKGLESIASMQNAVRPSRAEVQPEVVHQTDLHRKWSQYSTTFDNEHTDEERRDFDQFDNNTIDNGYYKPEGSMEAEEGSGGGYTDNEEEDEVNENSLPRIMEENLWMKKYDENDEEKVDEDFDRIYQEEIDHLDSDSLEG